MDIADLAEEHIEQLMAFKTKVDTRREAPFTGKCLWCGAKVKKGMRWCSPDCRDMYCKEQQMRKQNGTR